MGVSIVNTPIRVLIVDDSEDDTLLLVDEIRNKGYDLSYLRVDTAESMIDAINSATWDIIIADYTMPCFSGPAALHVLQDSGLDIPLILVSGTADEHTGIDMMRAGAKDFIIKHSLSRLIPAIKREITDAESRKQRKTAEDSARTLAENYQMIFERSPVAIATYDRSGVVLQINPAFSRLYGFGVDEVVGRHLTDTFVKPENSEKVNTTVARIFSGESINNAEWRHIRKDGMIIHVLANINPVYNERGEITVALSMMTDITERKLAEERERALQAHKREFYRRTILAATGGKLVIAEPQDILELAGPALCTWKISGLKDIEEARNKIRQLAQDSGLSEERAYNFISCAVEAMANVYKHVGEGIVTLHKTTDRLMLAVSDKGPGIEALALPDVALTRGYTTAESLGMGYKVMIGLADKTYLATSPEGTIVAIEMELKTDPSSKDTLLKKMPGW